MSFQQKFRMPTRTSSVVSAESRAGGDNPTSSGQLNRQLSARPQSTSHAGPGSAARCSDGTLAIFAITAASIIAADKAARRSGEKFAPSAETKVYLERRKRLARTKLWR
jgi:hypothetical protein